MPLIEIDFETFKEITARRPNEQTSEGDVVRAAFGLKPKSSGLDNVATVGIGGQFWHSEGVAFPVGSRFRHVFRDGRIAEAHVESNGIVFNGQPFKGLSPAAAAAAGHQANGWQFWEILQGNGRWTKADTLRR